MAFDYMHPPEDFEYLGEWCKAWRDPATGDWTISQLLDGLDSVIGLIERDKAHAVRFAQAGAVLMLIAAGTLVFGACVPLTGIPLVVLVAAFVICSFIGSQLFGGAILVMEEDQRKRPTQRDER